MIRIAAVGDLHVGPESENGVLKGLETVSEDADVLLLAGDLTQHGHREEIKPLADRLSSLSIPVIAVLGNHDYHQGDEDGIRDDLEAAGVVVLEGSRVELTLRGQRVGIAGAKGFGGGFVGACGTEFGEIEMKRFIQHTREIAARLREALGNVDDGIRIALTHYAPSETTLTGERLEIYPFLGSYLLAEAIDDAACQLAIHGHAHLGTERGKTPGGVPVRNVARAVIQQPYKIYCLSTDKGDELGCG